jgi:hypothetical protein
MRTIFEKKVKKHNDETGEDEESFEETDEGHATHIHFCNHNDPNKSCVRKEKV